MTENVKDWYIERYPSDMIGHNLNDDVTFALLEFTMNKGVDVYETLGDGIDSIVRERIFAELAERKGVEYEVIYDLWMGEV